MLDLRRRESTATRPRLAEDHCHYSDADRALLCQRCNRVLGMLWDENHSHGDSAELLFCMLEYLRHFCGAKFTNPHNPHSTGVPNGSSGFGDAQDPILPPGEVQ
jgi:hypothetical protein